MVFALFDGSVQETVISKQTDGRADIVRKVVNMAKKHYRTQNGASWNS